MVAVDDGTERNLESRHMFRSRRRAVAIAKKNRIVIESEGAKLHVSWELAWCRERSEQIRLKFMTRLACKDAGITDMAVELTGAHEDLAKMTTQIEDMVMELAAAHEELAKVNKQHANKFVELAVAHEELANVCKLNENKVMELAAANEELAKVNKCDENKVMELAAVREELAIIKKQKEKKYHGARGGARGADDSE